MTDETEDFDFGELNTIKDEANEIEQMLEDAKKKEEEEAKKKKAEEAKAARKSTSKKDAATLGSNTVDDIVLKGMDERISTLYQMVARSESRIHYRESNMVDINVLIDPAFQGEILDWIYSKEIEDFPQQYRGFAKQIKDHKIPSRLLWGLGLTHTFLKMKKKQGESNENE
jgi:hypothetical protein